MKNRGGGGRLLLTRNPTKDFYPEQPSGVKDLSRPANYSSNHGLAGGGGGLTGVPDPSLSACMGSTGKFSNRSVNPLGQRTCTQSILAAVPRPKCNRISLFE